MKPKRKVTGRGALVVLELFSLEGSMRRAVAAANVANGARASADPFQSPSPGPGQQIKQLLASGLIEELSDGPSEAQN